VSRCSATRHPRIDAAPRRGQATLNHRSADKSRLEGWGDKSKPRQGRLGVASRASAWDETPPTTPEPLQGRLMPTSRRETPLNRQFGESAVDHESR